MQPLEKQLVKLLEKINQAIVGLKINDKKQEAQALTEELADSDVWNNPFVAQAKSKQLSKINNTIDPWILLQAQAQDLKELLGLADSDMWPEIEKQIKALEKVYEKLEKDLIFTDPYDSYNVILRLTSGVGGTDAQDWTAMLERMYLRWAERSGMETIILTRSLGEEAGVKTSVVEVNGAFAYGKLRGEHGVHRLVRLSPFNANNLRQTSFALAEVLPQVDQTNEVEINENDLKIEVYRSSGKGGQSVNTTDSAVRVTHLPTGIKVAIQSERSQIQNRETALRILLSKLTQLQLEQQAKDVSELRAGQSANWGSQIRNYVMHPYSLVKDLRTKHEEKNVEAVLDGELDSFIDAFLKRS